jgi:hypothetical protein
MMPADCKTGRPAATPSLSSPGSRRNTPGTFPLAYRPIIGHTLEEGNIEERKFFLNFKTVTIPCLRARMAKILSKVL